ncbi:ORF6N domain-containing protein [Alkalimonas mucilaginosa]|uniref:ORF6N domain-containing protein n=1 Tax=Alkalimonas mucilaginosa TaxID=3057676 RepID=A0ABU7JBJ1_9GAMM|nr:ORF6N domain-containing protein [Alkalimonas sp. MEB004]MEE2023068.1 ORF6N domain-containing protein [Alkalimonas sp. MEB004]
MDKGKLSVHTLRTTTNPQSLQSLILTIRGKQVMLDRDLSELYQVDTKVLNQAVKRNIARFPESFRFQLTPEEEESLRSQIVTSSQHGGRRYLSYAFTEQGIAMLSAVLRSDIAIQVSIQIMQAFVQMRSFLLNNAALFQRLGQVEQKQQLSDQRIDTLFQAMEASSLPVKQGIFFDGQVFDAYVFANKLIKSANKQIVLIDNYIDESVLTMLSERKSKVRVTLMTSNVTKKLELDVYKHNQQYPGIELKPFNKAHDRFLIIDQHQIYHIGASMKDLGKKWFAFSKLELAALDLLQQAGVK